ncbi:MAG: hypothetical protein GY769_07090 [bacterium]|nr:hypothetical protein [bacterium]
MTQQQADEILRACLAELDADRDHGASELGRRALRGLGQYVAACGDLEPEALRQAARRAAERIADARPSMAPIENLAARWTAEVESTAAAPAAELASGLVRAADRLIALSRLATDGAAEQAAAEIASGATILTHSLSSTVVATFRRLADRGVRAIVSESRPLLEGHSTARRLEQMGIQTELITDAQIGWSASRADLALVGADTVLADGSVVNKAGTYLLALAMRAAGAPLWVCFESFKRSPRTAQEVELEEMPPSELGVTKPGRLSIRNVYFDITPAQLVTRWIDEESARISWSAAAD